MKEQNYHSVITAAITPQKAIENINRVDQWWTSHFEGSAKKLNDNFTVRFGETFVDFQVTERVADKKIVWTVTDCYLHWLKDKKEWKDTKAEWVISVIDNATQIDFTHIGLVPEIECYNNCRQGWSFYINKSLLKLMTEAKGLPDTPKEAQ